MERDNMNIENLEEILLEDGAELELIKKRNNGRMRAIPLVNLCKLVMYFNKAAEEIVPEYIRWYTTSEFVIGLPTSEHDRNGYGTWITSGVLVTTFPCQLRKDKKLKNGLYKVYKYKNGIAFKRYEQFELYDEEDSEVEE